MGWMWGSLAERGVCAASQGLEAGAGEGGGLSCRIKAEVGAQVCERAGIVEDRAYLLREGARGGA